MADRHSDEKARLRAYFRQKRQALPLAEQKRLSRLAAVNLLAGEAWQQSENIGLYMAARGETDCELLLEEGARQGKCLLLPCCDPEKKGRMRFFSCAVPQDLRPGPFGILEPRPDLDVGPEPDLLVIPGLAFDRAGRRLGQGGGYYDRYLARPALERTLRAGFCYDFQIVEALPADPWDMPMHVLCSEQGIVWINRP